MEDIFDKVHAVTGISKYSGSEVITPKQIVADMVDLLPAEVFNKDSRFLDPAVKSGRFLTEIYKRLMDSSLMVQAFPDEQNRHEHILINQLYGFATSAVAATIVRKMLYDNPKEVGNIRFTGDKVTKELIQGAFSIMKFDVVIGNPPYNKGMDLDFVDIGFELSKQYTVMITPAKWQTAAPDQVVASKNMTYGKFREKLVSHMSHVVFYPDSWDVFNIRQIDGISYFMLDQQNHATAWVKNICKLQKHWNSEENRSILDRKPLLNCGNNLIENMGKYPVFKLSSVDKSKRYQVWTNSQVSSAGGGGGGGLLTQEDGKCLFVGVSRIIDSTDTAEMSFRSGASTCSFSSDNKQECEYFVSWLNTKFTRFFVAINISKLTGIICDDCFRFVPAPPSGKFDHIYTDQELYDHYKLPQKYIDVIEAVIKERK